MKRVKDTKKLNEAIQKVIMKKREDCTKHIKAGISFDLTKLVEQVSASTRKSASQNLIEKLGLPRI